MNNDADLLEVTRAAIVPEHPPLAIEYGIGFVTGIAVPLAGIGADNRIGGMALPQRLIELFRRNLNSTPGDYRRKMRN